MRELEAQYTPRPSLQKFQNLVNLAYNNFSFTIDPKQKTFDKLETIHNKLNSQIN